MGIAALLLLLLQAPGDGWELRDSPPREIHVLYWSLFDTTETWVTLLPSEPAPRVRLVFQPFSPGRDPKRAARRLSVRALVWWQPPADKWVVVSETSLRVVVDGKLFDLTGPDRSSTALRACEDCFPNGVVTDLEQATLSALIQGTLVQGRALGYPFVLSSADRVALAEFAERIR